MLTELKARKVEREEMPVEVSGINIQNIPSHQKNIRLLFKATTIAKLVEAEGNEPFIVSEASEVETPNGWVFSGDLNIGDSILVDGKSETVKNTTYETASRSYKIEV